jgi:hypothetical protein
LNLKLFKWENTINSPQSFTTFLILHLIFKNSHHLLRYIAGWNESRSNRTLPGVWILIFPVVYCFLHWLRLTEGKTEKLVTKKSHAEHVRPFLSERTEITNGFVITKNLETFVGAHCKFLKIGGEIEKVVKLWGG